MKVNLKIFLPALPEAIGRKELEVQFAGETVNDLVTRYGRAAKQALYDEAGKLDPVVQVLLNGQEWITRDQLDRTLQDGDNVILMMMMAGG